MPVMESAILRSVIEICERLPPRSIQSPHAMPVPAATPQPHIAESLPEYSFMYCVTSILNAAARKSASSAYPSAFAAAYSGITAMMPCEPEPVMLIAGAPAPRTRASIAPAQRSCAVDHVSEDKSVFPFFSKRWCATTVRASRSPSSKSARFMENASRRKEISSIGTVFA